ncbi:MAG: hypothetical protein WC975_15160 [Phycisphaerae bacterium]
MKSVGIVFVLAVVYGAASLAPAQDMRDSSNWERGFEFTTDPTGGWSVWAGNPAAVTTVSGGMLNFAPTAGWTLWNTNSGSNPLGTGDWSYEWRVQVVSTVGANPLVYADTNSDKENVNFSVGFAGNGQIYGQYNVYPVSPVGDGVMATGGIDYSAYHTYRVTRTNGTGTPVAPVVGYSLLSMYVDDNPEPLFTKNLAMTTKNSDDMLGFGNGAATGEYNVDYIRWTTTGAYAPVVVVPPPVTVTVTGTVVPGDYVGDVSDLVAIIELRQGATVKYTAKKPLPAGGGFTMTNIAQDTYDVAVRVAGWLTNVQSSVVVSDNSTDMGTFNLINGDCSGDDNISSADLSIMLTNMDVMGG